MTRALFTVHIKQLHYIYIHFSYLSGLFSLDDLDLDHLLDDTSSSTVDIQQKVQGLNEQNQDEMDAQDFKENGLKDKTECNDCIIQHEHEEEITTLPFQKEEQFFNCLLCSIQQTDENANYIHLMLFHFKVLFLLFLISAFFKNVS